METRIEIDSDTTLNVFYNRKKMTKNQHLFLKELAKKSLNKSDISIFEFPPTLDKDFLYCSLLFSLKHQNFLNKKIIILVNSYEKIPLIVNNFAATSKHYNHRNNIKIIPFIERKYTCSNYDKLNKSNTYDYDNFCIEQNASWATERERCPLYKNVIENNKENIFCFPSNADIEDQIVYCYKNHLCPYYTYFYNIINEQYDIIICQIKDFFDLKASVSIRKIINFDNNIDNFLIIFDESNNLNENLINYYSNVIDEELILHARYELCYLKEKINKYAVVNYSMNIDEDEQEDKKNIKPEKEILNYSLFINGKCDNFPGPIRKTNHFLNLLSRLLIYFNNQFLIKNEKTTSIYSFQYALLKELWIEFRTLSHLYKRLIYQFYEIKYLNFSEVYHLIHFVIFINYMANFNEGFVINYSSYGYLKQDKYFIEMLLMEPNKFLLPITSSIYLSGGIGNINIFSTLLNAKVETYSDDYYENYNKNNILLTNTSTTTPSNPAFYGEMLKKLCVNIPDGIICYFSSIKLMEEYIKKWNEQSVFDFILDYKLIFIEENDSVRLSEIITNYKKSCQMGRGGILFLTMRNKGSLLDEMYEEYSRGIIFIGFPIETKVNKTLDLKIEYYNKYFKIDNEIFIKYDALKLFSLKIINKIKDSKDKKVIVILSEKLLGEKVIDYLPLWIRNMIHPEKEEDTNNVDDRIKMITQFFTE